MAQQHKQQLLHGMNMRVRTDTPLSVLVLPITGYSGP